MIQHLDQDLLSNIVSFLSKSERAILVESLKHLNQHFSKLFTTIDSENDDQHGLYSDSLMQQFDNLYIPTIHVKILGCSGSGDDVMMDMIQILQNLRVECLVSSKREFLIELDFPDGEDVKNNRHEGEIWKYLERECKYWTNSKVSLRKLYAQWKYSTSSINSNTLVEYSSRSSLVLNMCRLISKFRIHLILSEDPEPLKYPSFDFIIYKHGFFDGSHGKTVQMVNPSVSDLSISVVANMMANSILPKMDMLCNLPIDGLYSETEMRNIRELMRLNQWKSFYKYLTIQQNIICRHMNKVFHSNELALFKESKRSELRHKNAEDIIYIFTLIPLELLNDNHRIRIVKTFLETFFASELNISDEYRQKYIEKFPEEAMNSNGIHVFCEYSSSSRLLLHNIIFTFETVQFFKKCMSVVRQNNFHMAKYPSLSLSSMRHQIRKDLLYSEDTSLGKLDKICVEKFIRGVTSPIFFIPCAAYWSVVGLTCSCYNPYLYKDGSSTIMSCLDYDLFNYVFWSTSCFTYTFLCSGCHPLKYAEPSEWNIEDNKFRNNMTCNIL